MTTPLWQPGHLYLTGDLVQPIKAAPHASTVLTNPGFESGVITGWTVTQSGGTGTVSVASDKKYAGTYAGRWQGAGGSGHAGGVDADWVNDTEVPVKPGQSASATIYVSLDDTGSSSNQARARLYWYDASHAPLSVPHSDGLLIHGNTSAWYASTVTGIAPAGAAYARMGVWTTANGSGGVRVDSASWSIVAAAAPAGLIYKAVQADPGTSASSEPTWPGTLGLTVVDNTVTWEAVQASRVVWEASPICQSGSTEPDWPTDVGGFVTDGTISWECISRRVEDPNCPNSTVVAILAGKVFAADGDIVRFSATANPLDWSSADDAGYLPTGLQQANANDMAVLNQYRSNLVAFNASSFQNWQADPDPAAMAILDQMEGVGSTHQHAAQPVANDLFFLSQLGVRSVGISAGADNLSAGDIGMPIDVLVRAAMAQAAANGQQGLATYYPGAGQYWLAFRDSSGTPLIIGDGDGGTIDHPFGALTITGADECLAYSGTFPITGGVAPYGVSVTRGTLPTGGTLVVAGTDLLLDWGSGRTPGNYSFTAVVTDADGRTAQVTFSAEIIADSAIVGASYLDAGDDLTIVLPVIGAQAGDTLVLAVCNYSTDGPDTLPVGWTAINNAVAGTGYYCLAYKAWAGETSVTVSKTANDFPANAGVLLTLRGAFVASAYDSGINPGTTITKSSATSKLVAFAFDASRPGDTTPPADFVPDVPPTTGTWVKEGISYFKNGTETFPQIQVWTYSCPNPAGSTTLSFFNAADYIGIVEVTP